MEEIRLRGMYNDTKGENYWRGRRGSQAEKRGLYFHKNQQPRMNVGPLAFS